MFQNLSILLTSSLACVLLADIGLGLLSPESAFDAVRDLKGTREKTHRKHFTLDPDFGVRPIMGEGGYNEYGTLVNSYSLEKTNNAKRLLFSGDSVTRRGKIVEALRQLYGEEAYEYWNAGVEGFNTVQELNYYKRFNAGIQPDHVILTFHPNDFQTTPVAFYSDGRLLLYSRTAPLTKPNFWLLNNSHLYRFYLGMRAHGKDRDAIAEEVRKSLEEFQSILSQYDIGFTVLILPWMAPTDTWSRGQARARSRILSILETSPIPYIDLLDPLDEAIALGIDVQEDPGDMLHPSQGVSEVFARYIVEQDQLRKLISN